GYCNCRSCAGPWAGCRTASGRYPRANHTIAVDRRLIKLGTRVKIGRITYVAEDVGSAIRGRRVDIYYSSHSRASRHGVRWQTAKVYF
ncbi:MAG: 3D domain-containing protein, partial [Eubacterium sp.]|nr:3D domain-containing protein [Eubacterium sp.]